MNRRKQSNNSPETKVMQLDVPPITRAKSDSPTIKDSPPVGAKSGRNSKRASVPSLDLVHTDEDIKSGLLWKRGDDLVKKWKQRYFIIQNEKLFYTDNENIMHTAGERCGVVDLKNAEVRAYQLNLYGKQYAFGVTPSGTPRTYILAADTQENRASWVKSMAHCGAQVFLLLCEGWLEKTGAQGILKGFSKRYFTIHRDRVSYFKQPDASQKQFFVINKDTVIEVVQGSEKPFHWRVIPSPGGRVFDLAAKSQEEMALWIENMGKLTLKEAEPSRDRGSSMHRRHSDIGWDKTQQALEIVRSSSESASRTSDDLLNVPGKKPHAASFDASTSTGKPNRRSMLGRFTEKVLSPLDEEGLDPAETRTPSSLEPYLGLGPGQHMPRGTSPSQATTIVIGGSGGTLTKTTGFFSKTAKRSSAGKKMLLKMLVGDKIVKGPEIVVTEGWLGKMRPKDKVFKRRYVRLNTESLVWFKTLHSAIQGKPLGQLFFTCDTTVEAFESIENAFCVRNATAEIRFKAHQKDHLQVWISYIKQHIPRVIREGQCWHSPTNSSINVTLMSDRLVFQGDEADSISVKLSHECEALCVDIPSSKQSSAQAWSSTLPAPQQQQQPAPPRLDNCGFQFSKSGLNGVSLTLFPANEQERVSWVDDITQQIPEVVLMGHLDKAVRGIPHKGYKARFVLALTDRLLYYRTRGADFPAGQILYSDDTQVKTTKHVSKKNTFCIITQPHEGRVYHFAAESAYERSHWMQAISERLPGKFRGVITQLQQQEMEAKGQAPMSRLSEGSCSSADGQSGAGQAEQEEHSSPGALVEKEGDDDGEDDDDDDDDGDGDG